MTLSEELIRINSIFIDTAPIIYYIEAHPKFGPLAKEVVSAFQSGNLNAYSSVITLAEVLPKPIERGDEKLARKFAEFLKHGRNLTMIEISEGTAETAGKLRGCYPFLKTVDAIQLAAALDVGAGAFLTNDVKLQQFNELKVLALKDYEGLLVEKETMMRMARPAHPGQFIRMEVIEPLNLSVTKTAKVLGVTRSALSALLNGRAALQPDMAPQIEKAFGPKTDTLLRMQTAYEIAEARDREADIKVKRYVAKPPTAHDQATL